MSVETTTQAKTFALDPSHSRVGFAVRHMMLTKVRGHFGKVQGSLVLAGSNVIPQSISADIDVTSIDTRESQRDAHLRSADFFDAEHFAHMTFRSTRIEKKSETEFAATGDLTIRGTTRAVTLNVEADGRITDPYGKDRVAYTGKGKINRKEFGLAWHQALETGGVVVGDEVEIELEVEAVAV